MKITEEHTNNIILENEDRGDREYCVVMKGGISNCKKERQSLIRGEI
jgi:hypothetical protein